MEQISYSAHISNKKSAITSKAKLASVAKHNLRKYRSSDYSQKEVVLLYGTDNLMKDVKRVYREEFDEALKEYNAKQTREDRKIEDYFSHVAEIIFQVGIKSFGRNKRSPERMLNMFMRIFWIICNNIYQTLWWQMQWYIMTKQVTICMW